MLRPLSNLSVLLIHVATLLNQSSMASPNLPSLASDTNNFIYRTNYVEQYVAPNVLYFLYDLQRCAKQHFQIIDQKLSIQLISGVFILANDVYVKNAALQKCYEKTFSKARSQSEGSTATKINIKFEFSPISESKIYKIDVNFNGFPDPVKISSPSKHQKIGTYSQKGIDIEQSTIRRGKLTLHYRIEKSLIGQEVILRRCEANSAIPDHIRGHVIAGNFAQQSYCKRSEEISPTSCGQKLACFSTSCTEYKFRPQQEEDSVEFNILNLNKLREGTLNDLILYEPKSMRTSAIESREDVHPIEAIETGSWDGSCFAIDPYSSLWNTNTFFTNGSLYIVRQKNCTEESMILTKSCPESTSSTKRTILDQIIHFNKGEDLKMMPVSPQESECKYSLSKKDN